MYLMSAGGDKENDTCSRISNAENEGKKSIDV